MVIEEACGWCGEWFSKRGNMKYCCKECSELAEKEKDRLRRRKKANKETKTQGKKGISINGMVDLMAELSKKRGRPMQYGDVQIMLLTGQLKAEEGYRQ